MIQESIRQPRKRRGKCALIDPEQVRAMIAEGGSVAEVAERFDCSETPILLLVRKKSIKNSIFCIFSTLLIGNWHKSVMRIVPT